MKARLMTVQGALACCKQNQLHDNDQRQDGTRSDERSDVRDDEGETSFTNEDK